LSKQMRLQMAFKAVNDTAGPDGLVPTVLVFGAYPRMTWEDAPSTSIVARATAIKKAMEDVRKCHAARKVADALNMRNGPLTSHLSELPLNSEVIVYREGRGWDRDPHRLLGMDGQTCQVEINGRAVNFRSTVVRPFLRDPHPIEEPRPQAAPVVGPNREGAPIEEHNHRENLPDETTPRRSQRNIQPEPVAEPRQQPRNTRIEVRIPAFNPDEHILSSFFTDLTSDMEVTEIEAFLTEKENRDREMSLELRAKGIITTPGGPFIFSRRVEMDGLMAQGVYDLIRRDAKEIGDTRIFGSRMVDEVKGKETSTPYEKSRLVIQAYNDQGKKTVLTQSPTIQRVSQRIIAALAPSLFIRGILLFCRDITQAYIQSTSKLARPIYATPPKEMHGEFPDDVILKIIKPLYGIPEAGTHWFGTYFVHHKEKLDMETSTYDPCLLITKDQEGPFGMVGMQTDDTLILGDSQFVEKENMELKKAKLLAKPIESLTAETPLLFNGCKLMFDEGGDGLNLVQKGQGKRLSQIDANSEGFRQAYLEQRARGAYIASICQPEAAFDCSVAAQHQDPGKEEVKALNKRLKWQMENLDRGLHYVPLDLATAKLFVFVDGSFANNPDLSSQIGYVIVLGNETLKDGEFKLRGNILHWSSTKCKRVTRAVLASELYGMVAGIDMAISISTTLQLITKQLKVDPIPAVVCTDSFSLYECMVKLGTTKEKRLMIDIMAIRQSYERREISEIRWIEGGSNPADAMTKATSNGALQKLVSTNELDIKVQGWVQREALMEEKRENGELKA
jgi:Reverse transcriptase (RNA-dependent DNA polymerase)